MTFPKPELEGLGARIKERRQVLKLTLTELAQIAGLSRSYLHALEKGHSKKISATHLYSIAQSVHVTVEYLLGVENLQTSEDHAFYKRYLGSTEKQRYQIRATAYIVLGVNLPVIVQPTHIEQTERTDP